MQSFERKNINFPTHVTQTEEDEYIFIDSKITL